MLDKLLNPWMALGTSAKLPDINPLTGLPKGTSQDDSPVNPFTGAPNKGPFDAEANEDGTLNEEDGIGTEKEGSDQELSMSDKPKWGTKEAGKSWKKSDEKMRPWGGFAKKYGGF